jgi:hypothetical protein
LLVFSQKSPSNPEKRVYKRQKTYSDGGDDSRPKRVKHTPPPRDILPSDNQKSGKKAKLSESLKFCLSVLKELTGKKHVHLSWPFMQPVDAAALNLHDYHTVIKRPMDFGTILKNLEAGHYKKPDEFAVDVRTVFSNCFRYNPAELEITKMAAQLQAVFEARFAQMPYFPPTLEEHADSDSADEDSDDSGLLPLPILF